MSENLNPIVLEVEEVRVVNAVSPTVDLSRTENGALVSIHDYRGTQTVEILDGPVGPVGPQGESGAETAKAIVEEAISRMEDSIHDAQTIGQTVAGYRDAAALSAQAAEQSNQSSSEHARTAGEQAENSAQSAQAASGSATAAAGSASNAAQSATNAGNSASAASQSAQAASQSATNAAQSEQNAADSAQDAHDVLDSIPEDYSTLSSDVTDLKSTLTGTESSYYKLEEIPFVMNALVTDNVGIGETVTLTPTINTSYRYIIADCKKYDRFIVTCGGSNSARAWAFVDTDNKLLSKSDASVYVENLVLQAEADGKLILNANKNYTYTAKKYVPLREDVEIHESEIEKIEEEILTPVNYLITQKEVIANAYHINPNGTIGTNSAYSHSNLVYIRGCKKIYVTGYYAASVSPAVFYKQDKTYLSGFTADQGASTLYTYEIPVPENAYYVASSVQLAKVSSYIFNAVFDYTAKKSDRCYISTDGQDENDGLTEATAIKTTGRAKEILSDYGTLILMKGDYSYYSLNMDFDYFHHVLGIDHPRLICYDQKITSAELVSGYTRVYKAAKTSVWPSVSYGCLYQHDIPDAVTAIPSSEAHPLNRNRLYRLPSTRLIHASSIAEIESETDKYLWYYDNNDGNYYFSCPDPEHLDTYPIIVPITSSYIFGSNNSEVADISFENFAILYNSLSVSRCAGIIDNVEIGMCTGSAGLSADYCEALLVRNCNIYAVSGNNVGDGINVHNDDTTIGHRSLVTIENCWLHDCSDDGESCHGNSNTIHYGTLVEYNGTGITPAGGGTVCHDVISRHHGAHPWVVDTDICAGFSCQGNNSTLVCMGCVSEQNNRGYSVTESTASEQTTLTVIDSISRNNVSAEIFANRADTVLDDVTIVNNDSTKHIVTQNSATVAIKSLNKGIDSTGMYLQSATAKNYIN